MTFNYRGLINRPRICKGDMHSDVTAVIVCGSFLHEEFWDTFVKRVNLIKQTLKTSHLMKSKQFSFFTKATFATLFK